MNQSTSLIGMWLVVMDVVVGNSGWVQFEFWLGLAALMHRLHKVLGFCGVVVEFCGLRWWWWHFGVLDLWIVLDCCGLCWIFVGLCY